MNGFFEKRKGQMNKCLSSEKSTDQTWLHERDLDDW